MSVEGGIPGMQQRFVCAHCGKVFFAWRPDTHPAVKIKCYFCKTEMEDEAAKRPAAPAPAAPSTPTPDAAAGPAPAPPPPATSEDSAGS